MTNRERVENAVADVLRNRSIDNVRIDVNTDELKYPVVIVNMVSETKVDPRLASDIGVDVMCKSIIGREEAVSKSHYEFADRVRVILSARGANGIYSMLWGEGLPVCQINETIDIGTDILEEEGGSIATTTISLNFRLFQ